MGVVTEDNALLSTIDAVMETWSQSSSDLVFYSLLSGREENSREGKILMRQGRFRKTKGYNDIVRVVRVKPSEASEFQPRTKGLLPVLRHMYKNMLNKFDWFSIVPHSTYVRLNEMKKFLRKLDPSLPLLVGRPSDQDEQLSGRPIVQLWSGSEEGVSKCEVERGVVMSKQLLWELGRMMDTGVGGMARRRGCGEGMEQWRCLDQLMKTKCISQVNLIS